MNNIPDNIESKVCSKCGESFPATIEFWREYGKGSCRWHYTCRRCNDDPFIEGTRYCPKCGKLFALTFEFWGRDVRLVYGLSYECLECVALKNPQISNMGTKICSVCGKSVPMDCEDWVVCGKHGNGMIGTCLECDIDTGAKVIESRALTKKKWNNSAAPTWMVNKLSRYEEINGNMVQCAYCGKLIRPTNKQVRARLRAIIKGYGGSRIYCSEGCKSSCPIFNQKKYPKGFKPASSREANPLLRQLVLKRDDYTCQKCGATIGDKVQLHCHHVLPATQNPMTANDPENCIAYCKKCHIEVHKKPGCKNHELKNEEFECA